MLNDSRIKIKTAAVLALVGAPVIAVVWGILPALGWLAGAVWNLLNITILARLAALLGIETPKRTRKLTLLLLAKFGFLYPVGVGLLWSGAVHRVGFALGFTAVLVAAAATVLRPQPVVRVSRA